MHTFKFNHNDYVTVTLTKEGAEFLNQRRKKFYEQYPHFKNPHNDLQEDQIYRVQFWELINDFDEMLHIGMMSPFKLGEITVESSLEGLSDLFEKKVKAYLDK